MIEKYWKKNLNIRSRASDNSLKIKVVKIIGTLERLDENIRKKNLNIRSRASDKLLKKIKMLSFQKKQFLSTANKQRVEL